MSQKMNEYGQPIGETVSEWGPAQLPPRVLMQGRFCRLEPLDILTHVDELFEAFSSGEAGGLWTYMPMGPFAEVAELKSWMDAACAGEDPVFYAVINELTGKAVGFASYLRINPAVGLIEVGFIVFSPQLQKTAMATEAMYLMMRCVFDELGYRRYEWKCDALNAPSRKAALRFGFSFDGIFEQATIYKGRNRDTAWYSILDRDWPTMKTAFTQWLAEDNFDEQGQQKQVLSQPLAKAQSNQV
ncbi:GNAT family N-acetyltransferase [Granulosicoccus antarcticus]|uniref:N-acetyltransferase domain-containing protein n=1 Tax=Granulosicoccus antarcticus IMCC3135 TaxID=1192854 RepID=A0A2Z2NJE5_9GAMM|nr:GNAT family protein [Granulosicoccus antarcticus]ASJ71299.1 hypothetical protein IMCC3135_05935 [Granulosicoccus antarcticus IMCC3135]